MHKRYKEILFGFALGAAMWIIDVLMHVELGAEIHAQDFWTELFQPHATALVFRIIYLVIAVSFGVVLWRANWREREIQTLEEAVIAFYRQLDLPTLRILSFARQLQSRTTIKGDEISADLAESIQIDANLLSELAEKYQKFGEQVRNKQTADAVKTLKSIELALKHKNS